MPLLGRHKSLPGSAAPAAAANQSSSASRQSAAPVCESPLFGVRRQLPVASSLPAGGRQRTPPTISNSASLSSRLSSSSSTSSSSSSSAPSSCPSPSSPPSTTTNKLQRQSSRDGQLGSTLSSIPSQISRQQIHYAFSMMDTNSDGLIDLRDLSQMLANLGVPIDEAILSHVMAPVSKRGDQLISESEFLDWIGNFIQILDESHTSSTKHTKPRQRSPASRSVSAGSSLAAQSSETQMAIEQQLSKRRGSGSGLALVRSSSAAPSKTAAADESAGSSLIEVGAAAARRERQLQDQLEARRDLKAAFCVFDLDGDGFITLDEVHQGLKLLGETWSQAELNQLFSQCSGSSGGSSNHSNTSSKATTSRQRTNLGQGGQRISIDDFVHLLL